MYSINDVYELLPTLSFDFIYDYFLAYEGGETDNLLNNILKRDAFLAKLPEIEKMEESINETNSQIKQEGGNSVNQNGVTNTHEEKIEKMKESINEGNPQIEQEVIKDHGCFGLFWRKLFGSKKNDSNAHKETNINTNENTHQKDSYKAKYKESNSTFYGDDPDFSGINKDILDEIIHCHFRSINGKKYNLL